MQDSSKRFSPHQEPVFHRSWYVSNCNCFLKDNFIQATRLFYFQTDCIPKMRLRVGSLRAGIHFSFRNTVMVEFPGKCTKTWSAVAVYPLLEFWVPEVLLRRLEWRELPPTPCFLHKEENSRNCEVCPVILSFFSLFSPAGVPPVPKLPSVSTLVPVFTASLSLGLLQLFKNAFSPNDCFFLPKSNSQALSSVILTFY